MSKQNYFKWFKRATLVLAIIPVLLFLAFAGAVSLIDFNQYKPQIEQEVSNYTGREFKIDGSIDVSILPFMFRVNELALKNSDAFDAENLLTVHSAQIELSLISFLLYKEMNVIRLELFEPKLHLIKNAQGNNWSDIKGLASWFGEPLNFEAGTRHVHALQTASEWFESLEKTQVSVKPEAQSITEATDSSDNLGFLWAFDSLVVHDGKVQLYEKVQGFAETISNINVLMFDVAKEQPFDVSSDFVYQNSLSERVYDVHLNGVLTIKDAFKVWQLSQWNGVLRVRLPEEQKIPDIRLTTQGELFEFNMDTLEIAVQNGFLSGLDGQLTTSFSGQFGLNTLLSGTVDFKQLNFKEWAYHLKVPLPKFVDSSALSEGNGRFEWHWDGSLFLLNKLDLQVDETTIKGDLSYHLDLDKQLTFDLTVSDLNLERYKAYVPLSLNQEPEALVSIGGGKNLTNPPETALTKTPVYLPVPLSKPFLARLNADGDLKVMNLSGFDIKIDSLEVELLAQAGLLQFAPLDVHLYQGELLSQLKIDLRVDEPVFHWKGRVNHLELAEPLSTRSNSPIRSGLLVSRFDLKTKGHHKEALKSQLNGVFSATLEDVPLSGLDLNALLAGNLPLTDSGATVLKKVSVLGRWKEGVYSARKLDARSERFSVTGAGTYDLTHSEVDAYLNVLIEKPEGGVKILKGFSLPFVYQGVLTSHSAENKASWKVDLPRIANRNKAQKALIQTLFKDILI